MLVKNLATKIGFIHAKKNFLIKNLDKNRIYFTFLYNL
jgi:hypothetical protein